MKDEALHIHTLQSNLVLKTEKFYQRVICEKNLWICHPIEHQMSAVYNITHGLGLAIVTPRWMEFVLDENNAEIFCRFGKLSLQQI